MQSFHFHFKFGSNFAFSIFMKIRFNSFNLILVQVLLSKLILILGATDSRAKTLLKTSRIMTAQLFYPEQALYAAYSKAAASTSYAHLVYEKSHLEQIHISCVWLQRAAGHSSSDETCLYEHHQTAHSLFLQPISSRLICQISTALFANTL